MIAGKDLMQALQGSVFMDMLRLIVSLTFVSCFVAACSPSHEELAQNPANCEQMNDIPEAYEYCLEALR